MLDILGKRYLFFAISALLILPGLIVMAIWGMPMSIDFQGGTLLDLSFASGTPPAPADVATDVSSVIVPASGHNFGERCAFDPLAVYG